MGRRRIKGRFSESISMFREFIRELTASLLMTMLIVRKVLTDVVLRTCHTKYPGALRHRPQERSETRQIFQ